jgi:hypothetical protein
MERIWKEAFAASPKVQSWRKLETLKTKRFIQNRYDKAEIGPRDLPTQECYLFIHDVSVRIDLGPV